MSIDHPALLSLHGVDRKELEALEITEVELAYMVNCIYADRPSTPPDGGGACSSAHTGKRC